MCVASASAQAPAVCDRDSVLLLPKLTGPWALDGQGTLRSLALTVHPVRSAEAVAAMPRITGGENIMKLTDEEVLRLIEELELEVDGIEEGRELLVDLWETSQLRWYELE